MGRAIAVVSDLSGDGDPDFLVDDRGSVDDENQTGQVLLIALEADCDGDGVSPFGSDCDDADSLNYPGNVEPGA